METITGIREIDAIGQTPGDLWGEGGAALERIEQDQRLAIDGLGTVSLMRQGDYLVGTVGDHEREAFLGMAAHDLRAPLRNVLFLADEAIHNSYDAHALLTKIKQIARQGLALTNDVVSCAQSAGVSATSFTKFPVKPLCDTILATLDVGIGHSVTANDATVLAERPVVQLVLRNLIDNAIRHGGHRTRRIFVDVLPGDNTIDIQVRDNGEGFGPSARTFLSGGEFRVESGYGLVAIRRLIRSRGGRIDVSSNENQPGSTVSVSLPGCILDQDRVAVAS